MTTYTFETNFSGGGFWDDPTIWSAGLVPNSPDADVVFPTATIAGQIYDSAIIISPSETFGVNSVVLANNYLGLAGTLNVTNLLWVQPGGEIILEVGPNPGVPGSLSAGSLVNDGAIVASVGTISVTGTLVNEGGFYGEGVPIGALNLTLGGLLNTGSISEEAATLGPVMTVTVAPGGFANLSGTTLNGGTYISGSDTRFNTLDLNVGGSIVTDAATIEVGGENCVIETYDSGSSSYVSIQSTLTTVAKAGTLSLAFGTYDWGALTIDGTLSLNQMTFDPASLTIDAGGRISGNGTVETPVTMNGGTIEVLATDSPTYVLDLAAGATGGGTLEVGPGIAQQAGSGASTPTPIGILELGGASDVNVVFANNVGILQLDDSSGFTGSIAPVGSGDQIVLGDVSLSSVKGLAYDGGTTGGTLFLQEGDTGSYLNFIGNFSAANFALSTGPDDSLVITVISDGATIVPQDYIEELLRSPDSSGLSSWSSQIDSGTMTPVQVAQAFAQSTEAQNNVLPIVRLYEGLFDRAPDAAGIQFWVHLLAAGTETLPQIAAQFVGSAEFAADYGNNAGTTAFVTALYENVLHRAPDPLGLSGWVGQLTTMNVMTEAAVVLGFTQSVEFMADANGPIEQWLANAGETGVPAGTFPIWPGTVLDLTNLDSTALNPVNASDYAGVSITGQDILPGGEYVSNLPSAASVLVQGASGTGLTLAHADPTGYGLAIDFVSVEAPGPNALTFLVSTGDANIGIASGTIATFDPPQNQLGQLAETDNSLLGVELNGSEAIRLGSDYPGFVGDGVVTDISATSSTPITIASSLQLIDASETTGGVAILAGATNAGGTAFANGATLDPNVTVTYDDLTITGGSGTDFIENDAFHGVVTDGNGSGDQVILGGATASATLGTGAGDTATVGVSDIGTQEAPGTAIYDTVTFGAGASAHLIIGTGAEVGATPGSTAIGQTNVSGAAAGMTIDLSAVATSANLMDFTATQATLTATEKAAVAALAGAGFAYFDFGGSEYIVAAHGSEAVVAPNDAVVHLIGVTGIGMTDNAGILTLV